MNFKIQIITNNKNFQDIGKNKISAFNNFKSLDSYDFNIIDLNNAKILEYNKYKSQFTIEKDFITLSDAITNMKTNNKIIFLSPQNIEVRLLNSNFSSSSEKISIKDKVDLVCQLLSSFFKFNKIDLMYDQDETKIGNTKFESDFCIREKGENDTITKNKHDKITTVQNDKLLFTTLNLNKLKAIIEFLTAIGLIINKNNAPKWFNEINCYDDEKQFQIIDEEKEKIKKSEMKIKKSQDILENNNHFKSILYTNSNELVNVVFEILEEILKCDLSNFVDERKEDFLIKFENEHVLIGEIKGVNSNIKYEPIDQLERHYHIYLEEHPESENETIKQVLIINYEKEKKPEKRTKIHMNQINLAKRNGCLIIPTPTLLEIHQSYRNCEINTNQLINYIFNKSGVFIIDELKKN